MGNSKRTFVVYVPENWFYVEATNARNAKRDAIRIMRKFPSRLRAILLSTLRKKARR